MNDTVKLPANLMRGCRRQLKSIAAMRAATFWIDHKESNSRVVVEFALVNKQVKLIAIAFLRGQVVDIGEVRKCHQRAKKILLFQDEFFPSDGPLGW